MALRKITPIILLASVFFSGLLYAQVDPSSALLLRSSGKSPDKEELDSSRYTVRPSNSQKPPRSEANETKVETEGKASQQTNKGSVSDSRENQAEESVTQEVPATSDEGEKRIDPKIRNLFVGGSAEEIIEYKRHLSYFDPRHNLVEIDIAPTYIYNESSSNYWYRRYRTQGPGVNLEARLWLTPFMGVYGSFLTSLSTSMATEYGSASRRPVDHQWFRAGVKVRRYFGLSRKSPYLTFGLGFREYQLRMTSDIEDRVGLRSAGAEVSVEATIPSSYRHAWLMGVDLTPRVNHSENKTDLELKSGTSEESNMFGVWLGSRYNFDGRNQVYWKIYHSVENHAFEGQANQADPATGSKPTGVSVINGMTRIELGYTWGN